MQGSFHDAIGPVLLLSQFFGIMPVDNINSKDVSKIDFRWKSVKTVYSLVFLIFGSIECLLCLRLLFTHGMTLAGSSSLSFYFISIVGAICLFNLATKWKRLMQFWYKIEKIFLKAPYIVNGWPLKRKIRVWAATIGFLALSNWFCSSWVYSKLTNRRFSVDHALFLMTSFYNNQQIINICHVNESEFFHSYLIAYRYHLTTAIPYHFIQFPIYAWVNILMTFSWSFIDLLIILISVALSTRFNQINFRLIDSCSDASSNKTFWSEIRTNYYALIDLVDEIDQEISILILVSTGHNLFSLCVIIFESLTR